MLTNLQELSVGQNPFTSVDRHSFKNLKKLKKLQISGCPYLQGIGENSFGSMADLEEIQIAFNRQLRHMDPASFGSLSNIKYLDISYDALTQIPQSLVPWQQLLHLDLSGNPWNCDCEAAFLKNVLINSLNKSAEGIRTVK